MVDISNRGHLDRNGAGRARRGNLSSHSVDLDQLGPGVGQAEQTGEGDTLTLSYLDLHQAHLDLVARLDLLLLHLVSVDHGGICGVGVVLDEGTPTLDAQDGLQRGDRPVVEEDRSGLARLGLAAADAHLGAVHGELLSRIGALEHHQLEDGRRTRLLASDRRQPFRQGRAPLNSTDAPRSATWAGGKPTHRAPP